MDKVIDALITEGFSLPATIVELKEKILSVCNLTSVEYLTGGV